MSSPTASASLQSLLDAAIAEGAAPGLVACAFDRTSTFASASAGVSSVKTGARMTLDTSVWLFSASKTLVSLAALAIVEKEGFNLDSHEELVKVVPELGKDWPDTRLWTLFDGKDDKGEWRFNQATKGITLRHLLSHTSGLAYVFDSEEMAWLDEQEPLEMGNLKTYNVPRLFEAGEGYKYGASPGFLALFIIRKSGKSLRRAFWDLIFSPLCIAPNTLDIFATPTMRLDLAEVCGRGLAEGTFAPLPVPFEPPMWEDDPPAGYIPFADGPGIGKLWAFAAVLRSFLNGTAPAPGATPLLSPEMWAQASTDDLARRGLAVPQRPFFKSAAKWLCEDVERWAEPKDEGASDELGWSLMQTLVHRQETKSGLKPGTLEWAGIANTFFFVDPSTGVGGVISAQYLPASNAMLEDRWVYEQVEGGAKAKL
ncbi:hypothetical protein JCM10207_004579 [Rhodosporidiobolus poonsookiae]